MLVSNPRTSLMAKNITKMSAEDRQALRAQAAITLKNIDKL
jgi:deoxyribodipyrimidine photolyase-like uncharacterized protein